MNEDTKPSPFYRALQEILERSDQAGLDTGKILGESLVKFFTKIEPQKRMPKTGGFPLSIKNGKLVESGKE